MTIEEMKAKLVESHVEFVRDMVIQDRHEELYDFVETHFFSDFRDVNDEEIIEQYEWLNEDQGEGVNKCQFCREEYTCDVDNGFCDECWFEVGIWRHEQLWVFEETAIEYGWTKETSPIAVIDPDDEIWDDEDYDWVRD